MEDLLARIDASRLNSLEVFLFHQLIFNSYSTCHTVLIVGQEEGVTLPDENSYQSEEDYLSLRYLYEGRHTRKHIDRQPNVHTVADYAYELCHPEKKGGSRQKEREREM
jgi:hypothetical protein